MTNKTIGIIFSLQKEFDAYYHLIENPEELTILNHQFYKGTYNNNTIILTRCGIGKVNAASFTTLLIQNFHPDIVFNSGIAGSTNPKIKTLDTILAEKLIYADVDMTSDTTISVRFGQLQDLPAYFSLDKWIKEEIYKLGLDIKYGSIMTADCFQTNYQTVKRLIDDHFSDLDILACDMESAAIAQICFINKIPFVIIRSISDIVGSTQEIDYPTFCPKAASKSAMIVNKIIDGINL